ncbi:hypothetical protein ABI_08290 [Asticcacaulis biprosthecium C19]|uniref:Uncharacterized protein n=1 Tax=Asticcacaulis biprosthecium C19 TaxID=715226 RepID=F4QLX4_9CAUL|nr:hypothetical protein ABI_08290 [Asticcacaulis biprosthecium C19]
MSVPARRDTWARRNLEKLWQAISLLLFLALLVGELGRL